MKVIILLSWLFLGSDFKKLNQPKGQYEALKDIHRVINGFPIKIEQSPHQAGLLCYELCGLKLLILCGGSLISENHVLTAAHCMILEKPEDWRVRLGSEFWDKGGFLYRVSKIFLHPKFNYDYFDYDAAVIRLSKKVTLNEQVQPAPIIKTKTNDAGYMLISGWGLTEEDITFDLMGVFLREVPKNQCRKIFRTGEYYPISERMICGFMMGKGLCYGDSGGSAVINGELAGIVSWGADCADPIYPEVLTDVLEPSIRQFIKDYADV